MKDAQRGFIDMPSYGLIFGLGVVAGLIASPILSWAWGLVKPLLHAVTV